MPTQQVSRTVSASWEPVEIHDVKKHLEIPDAATAHDGILSTLVTTAREIVEEDTGLIIPTSTCVLNYDEWPAHHFELPQRPVSSITTIKYYDTAGNQQTWNSANYTFDSNRVTPCIFLAYSKDWPTIRTIENAIEVTYVAGYASQSVIPNRVQHAVLIKVSQLFIDREGMDGVTGNVRGLGNAAEFESLYQALIARLMRSTYP